MHKSSPDLQENREKELTDNRRHSIRVTKRIEVPLVSVKQLIVDHLASLGHQVKIEDIQINIADYGDEYNRHVDINSFFIEEVLQ
jgi:hypothetical protein